jgi:hypothetical protein
MKKQVIKNQSSASKKKNRLNIKRKTDAAELLRGSNMDRELSGHSSDPMKKASRKIAFLNMSSMEGQEDYVGPSFTPNRMKSQFNRGPKTAKHKLMA